MKLISFVMAKALLFVFCANALYAQDESTSSSSESSNFSIQYGAKLGVVNSQFNSSYHAGSKIGFTAGIFGSYEINEMLGVQAELAYFQFGGSYLQFRDESRFGGSDDIFNKNVKDADVSLHNIYLPIQLSVKLFDNPLIPKILVGPYISYTPYATESYQTTGQLNGGVFVTSKGSSQVTDQYKDFQFGATMGFQFEIPSDADYSLLIGANYQYGITPVKQSFSYIDFVEVTENVYSNAFNFSVGVQS